MDAPRGIRPLWRVPGIVLRERAHPPGRVRVPEPMVMDDPESVAHFHEGGLQNPGMQAVYDFGARAVDALLPLNGRLLDLGVGSGRALSAIVRRRPDLKVTAVDLAPNMLATAQRLFEEEGIDGQIELVKADITALPDALADGEWDGVSCMWTLHQLPEVEVLRGALRQIAAVRRKNDAAVWISDFQRLRDPSATEAMLQCVDPLSPLILRKDAMASESAAFTIDELAAELAAAGLEGMSRGHARPLPYLQAFWAPGARSPRSPIATSSPLRGAARREAMLLSLGFSAKPF
ncbi:class I SAM-dependent methyltransferase [Mycobacterium sp. AT1]|uniref:class I SAM-dependent methyltransferase n=1 Tax=Mycobacterium sp. AT1 TaxID=1961706 RepID=UPI001E5C4A60|nr:class I SAM-dependent methyltransferase [Mycobacterium sp. AT1]